MFNELKWLTFPKRVHYHTCTTVYKFLHGLAPGYLSDVFTRISMVHNRNLRSVDNDLLRVPTSKTNFYEKVLYNFSNQTLERYPSKYS